MCLYGFSNGGGVVDQLVTMTDRFKCAVSVGAALSADWSTPFFLQTNAKFIGEIAGATPWEDTDSYIKLSAIYRLPKVHTPMLLADGDADTMFLIGCIEMYNGLRFLGKDVTFLRYPGQGHGFEGAAMKDFWERENSFFDKYLTP
jgi:dipeptidyl aminopeptidase/acylaminoacyl peptidase